MSSMNNNEALHTFTPSNETLIEMLADREPRFAISDIPQGEYRSRIEIEPSSRELARRAIEARQQRIEEAQASKIIREMNEHLLLLTLADLRVVAGFVAELAKEQTR